MLSSMPVQVEHWWVALGVVSFNHSAPVPLRWWFSGAGWESGEAQRQTRTAGIHGDYKLQRWVQMESLKCQHRSRFACGKGHRHISFWTCGTDLTQSNIKSFNLGFWRSWIHTWPPSGQLHSWCWRGRTGWVRWQLLPGSEHQWLLASWCN